MEPVALLEHQVPPEHLAQVELMDHMELREPVGLPEHQVLLVRAELQVRMVLMGLRERMEAMEPVELREHQGHPERVVLLMMVRRVTLPRQGLLLTQPQPVMPEQRITPLLLEMQGVLDTLLQRVMRGLLILPPQREL
jgi:hypothetical protein